MLIFNANELRQALPMKTAIAAMKDAYAALSDGTAVAPLRTRLPIPSRDAISLFMPAYKKKESTEALAVKVVSLYPSNPPRGLAYIQAAVLVFDAETGRAIELLEGSALTAIRTGPGRYARVLMDIQMPGINGIEATRQIVQTSPHIGAHYRDHV